MWIVWLALSLLAAACGTSEAPSEGSSSTATETEATTTPVQAEPTAAPVEVEAEAAPREPEPAPSPDETASEEPGNDAASPPAEPATNDLLIDAIVIEPAALPFVATVDTTDTTSDGDDERVGCPAPQTDASVWYSFTSSVDMVVKVSGEGSDYPVGISAISGEPDSFFLIECRPFAFEVAIEANSTHHFQVFDGDDPASQGGTLVFRIEEARARRSTEGLEPLGQEFVEAVAGDIAVTDGAFMLAVVNAQGEAVSGSAGDDGNGAIPTTNDLFRVGSITKVFTSLATLTLVDDGVVDLDAAANDYVSRVPVPDDVTVRDLLRHTSGIFNYTEAAGVIAAAFADPGRVWIPEEVVGLVADQPSQFEPGSEFSYSNTNYIILGVLIEEITGQAYHEVVRERILAPLELSSTYLGGFENGPEVFDPYEHLGDAHYDYTSIASGAWSAGAMVSSVGDLHRLFAALFDAQIVSSDLVAQMTDGDEYGLGMVLALSDEGLYGHDGGIPGYSTNVWHSPELGVTAFWASTDNGVNPSYADQKMIEGFAALAPE